jgi:hypothetical protein
MRADYVLAWLLPLLLGAGLCGIVAGRSVWHGRMAAVLGTGWLVGVFIAAFAASWLGQGDTVNVFAAASPWLLGFAILVWAVVAIRRRWARRVDVPPASAVAGEAHASIALRALWWLLGVAIVLRLLLLGDEASLRPVFPWDAWSAWSLKPKSWLLLGQAEPYVSMADWLGDAASAARTAATWHYPELLAWIQVWFASSAGGWNEPLVNLAWCGALAAFALAAYGYWRGLGLNAALAMGLVYALVSLPLIDAHVALAGYADLWIAVTLGLATLAWSRWLVAREPGQWLLGAGLALCLPAIKLEGAIWLVAFAAVVILDLLPARWRWRIAGGFAIVFVLGLAVGGFSLPIPGLGWVRIAWGEVGIPAIPAFDLSWRPVGGAMLASLFTLPNWHLLWYLLPLLVALRWRVLVRDHAARLLGLLVLLQLVFLFGLFFFTSASAWAEDFTSANRLILQIVPCVFAFAAMLLRQPPRPSPV